jgi:dnd system-associated protein 4
MPEKRIRRPAKYEQFMNKIASSKGDAQVFDSLKDCLVFSAALGYKNYKREPFRDSSEPIQFSTFSGNYDKIFINALAIKESGDTSMLNNSKLDDKILIFEEYACGGLSILENKLALNPEKEIVAMLLREVSKRDLIDDITNM